VTITMRSKRRRTGAPWTLTAGALALSAACGVTAQQSAGQRSASSGGLTDVAGLRVGQHTLTERPTGCTVILVEGDGAVGGISQRGAAPGTRETDLLDPLNMVERVNAVVLTGGSAYGLDAAQGVVRFLEERKVGFPIAGTVVPIVPAAVLMDLGFGGSASIRPTADCGYRAASAASTGTIAEGNVGAGAGATVGKLAGRGRAMKGGIGTASITLPNGLVVAAIAAVNSIGDVVDPVNGAVVAGVRSADGKSLADARKLLRAGPAPTPSRPGENTTLALVATNAVLSKTDVNRVALMADDGLARAVIPSHTSGDGDTVFALATGRWQGEANASTIGALAAEALAEAIVRAAAKAAPLGGLPAARDFGSVPARLR
jgi:L-aminopeptidase/D-esterase-like protein